MPERAKSQPKRKFWNTDKRTNKGGSFELSGKPRPIVEPVYVVKGQGDTTLLSHGAADGHKVTMCGGKLKAPGVRQNCSI